MKFPVQRKKSKSGFEVKAGMCPVCRGPLNRQPGSFAFVNGGALKKHDDGSACAAADLIGFLSLGFHGAHGEEKDEASALIDVADDVPMGQFEFYFCSTTCLRGFFNSAVDELECRLVKRTG